MSFEDQSKFTAYHVQCDGGSGRCKCPSRCRSWMRQPCWTVLEQRQVTEQEFRRLEASEQGGRRSA